MFYNLLLPLITEFQLFFSSKLYIKFLLFFTKNLDKLLLLKFNIEIDNAFGDLIFSNIPL